MRDAWKQCADKTDGDFCIIGAVKNSNALNHEIAHGLFYLHPEYKKEMVKLVKNLPVSIKTEMKATLKKLGYTPKVYVDEMQAYMSTGISYSDKDHHKYANERKPFEILFKKFSKKNK